MQRLPAPAFDLQSHSNASDGTLPPREVVRHAREAGVELLALTDHDTVDGVEEARVEARRLGMRFSRASEISAVHGGREDLHVCGYELDHTDPILLHTLEEWRADRQRRILAMAERMRELGFELEMEPLEARMAAGRPLGRPHLADAVLRPKGNHQRLAREQVFGRRELFPAYLVPGAPGYLPRTRPTVREAIDVIHAAGGVAVWAHPFWDVADPQEVRATVAEFASYGLDGVEVFYGSHSEEQTHVAWEAADAWGLLKTGSSDFHSPSTDPLFSSFLRHELYGLEPDLGPIGAS